MCESNPLKPFFKIECKDFKKVLQNSFVFHFAFQIYISKKWGFTKFNREDYEDLRAKGRLQQDGSHVKYLPEHGPLSKWCKVQMELAGL